MTVFVEIKKGRVTDTAPITRRFIGQPIRNLREWLKRQGGYRECPLIVAPSCKIQN